MCIIRPVQGVRGGARQVRGLAPAWQMNGTTNAWSERTTSAVQGGYALCAALTDHYGLDTPCRRSPSQLCTGGRAGEEEASGSERGVSLNVSSHTGEGGASRSINTIERMIGVCWSRGGCLRRHTAFPRYPRCPQAIHTILREQAVPRPAATSHADYEHHKCHMTCALTACLSRRRGEVMVQSWTRASSQALKQEKRGGCLQGGEWCGGCGITGD